MPSSRSSRLSRLLPFRSRRGPSAPEPHKSPPADLPALAVEPAAAGPSAVDDPCPQGLEIVAEGVDPLVESVPLHPYGAAILTHNTRLTSTASLRYMASTATAKRRGSRAMASTGSAISFQAISLRLASSAGAMTPTPTARVSAANISTTMHGSWYPICVGRESSQT